MPLDLSGDLADLQALPSSAQPWALRLNNPYQGRPAQVLGTTMDGVSFRYTTASTSGDEGLYELFAFPVLSSNAINDLGSFCGCAQIAIRKNSYKTEPFRLTQEAAGTTHEVLPTPYQNVKTPSDMNIEGDMVAHDLLYVDEWGTWIDVGELVVGSPEDVARWHELDAGWLCGSLISNRITIGDAAISVKAGIIAGVRTGAGFTWDQRELYLLKPEPEEWSR
jgi:hypothetical protein